MRAQCQCGQLCADVSEASDQIVACHCLACQRRSGAPFGVIAYYPAEAVALTGRDSRFTRTTEAGNEFTTGFCPDCGATVWAKGSMKPGVIGIPIGAFADKDFPAPVRSVWEQSKHSWVVVPNDISRFPRGRT